MVSSKNWLARVAARRQAGRPDWANFSLLGDGLSWIVFVKIAEIAQIIGLFFSMVKVVY
jgi:hypothetical protein